MCFFLLERERARERERERDRQTDRQTERERESVWKEEKYFKITRVK